MLDLLCTGSNNGMEITLLEITSWCYNLDSGGCNQRTTNWQLECHLVWRHCKEEMIGKVNLDGRCTLGPLVAHGDAHYDYDDD
ncbi:hypothetical protein VNO77_41684 [Canavalia gladiata]|uniref:Uncharacterized protein n=1 Tax=Canavalia gladiata TaxID=3824 RepID=A0AAN9PS11_CANGL